MLKQINENKDSNLVIDPFKVKFNWFIIDFDANIIKPNTDLNSILRAEIINTITILGLNNLIFQNRRISWIDAYYRGVTDFT